jgi:hypothetical protein
LYSNGFIVDQIDLPGWRIEFDRAATVAAYEKLLVGGPESCGCDHCRNWANSRSKVYPADFAKMLNQLGIPLDRECEVYHNGKESDLHLYAGWYHFVGRVVSGERECSANVSFVPFSVFFHSKPALLPDAFAGQPVVQLEFEAGVPWLSEILEPV